MDAEQVHQFTTWLDADVRSTPEAIDWVEQQFELSYSDSGMRKLVGRLDYRFKQPSVLPAKADVEAQAAWVESYTAKKGTNAPRQGLLSRCCASAAITSRGWIKRGQSVQLKTNSGRNRLNIHGAYYSVNKVFLH